MTDTTILESELPLNPDGSIYHLRLMPEDIGDTIITVGDPDRVAQVSHYFDSVDIKKQKREFVTHTGFLGGERITAISSGIGTDNMDILINELDALVNVDFKTRQPKKNLKSLRIIRIGTCGGLQEQLPVNSHVVSTYGLGFDNLMDYYAYQLTPQEQALKHYCQLYFKGSPRHPYVFAGSGSLIKRFEPVCASGITATFSGFYGPQMRNLRGPLKDESFMDKIQAFHYQDQHIANFEMETAGLYGLGNVLQHQVCTVCVVIANRVTHTFCKDLNGAIDELIKVVIGRL